MKAIIVKMKKDEPRLKWQDAPVPEITRDEVLVDVKATAVNSVPIWP
jgi:NADPH:quinone reductase-like Zn-dependent oxidoreductase